jgi:hypothetical protein
MNTFGNLFPMAIAGKVLLIGLALFAIVSDRMWKRLPTDSMAVYRPTGIGHRNAHPRERQWDAGELTAETGV